jgi:hypothetical protein
MSLNPSIVEDAAQVGFREPTYSNGREWRIATEGPDSKIF